MECHKIGQITPSGGIIEFNGPIYGNIDEIVAESDGNLWFTEFDVNKIGRITPSGNITVFALPASLTDPLGITAGPNGNIWFTAIKSFGRITTSGKITKFATPNAEPLSITIGPDSALWFTQGGNKIGRFTLSQ